mgnify:CR=1 FL=1
MCLYKMAKMRYADAITQALREEMNSDENVFIIGEEVGQGTHHGTRQKVSERRRHPVVRQERRWVRQESQAIGERRDLPSHDVRVARPVQVSRA